MKGVRPVHDRVLVRRIQADEKTPGGIIIPDTAKEKPVEGEVLAVGAGARDENGRIVPLDVKVGDRVLSSANGRHRCDHRRRGPAHPQGADILGVIEGKARAHAKAA